MSHKIDVRSIALAITDYNTNKEANQHLRLGQYLMNELAPSENNPDIFYEKNNRVAVCKFVDQYGLIEEG